MSFKRLIHSIIDAAHGVAYTFRNEQNFRIQIFLAVVALGAAFIWPLRRYEQIVVMLLVFLVLSMELLNTAVEKFSDLLAPRLHEHIRTVKDVMAAAVLTVSIGALLIGLLIFWPHLVSLVV